MRRIGKHYIVKYILFPALKKVSIKRADSYALKSIIICSFFSCIKTINKKCRAPPQLSIWILFRVDRRKDGKHTKEK